jgi:integrase
MALTIRKVQRLTKPGKHFDRDNLYLQILNSENRSWQFRYKRFGKDTWMGLGSIKDFTLDQARERAREQRQLLARNIDPLTAKRDDKAAAKLAANNHKTLKECVDGYVAALGAVWSPKLKKDFLANFVNYVYPDFANVPIANFSKEMILQIIEPIWLTKNATASRIRGRLEDVLGWATDRGYRSGINPAAWSGLKRLLADTSKLETKHRPALPFADAPVFVKALQKLDGIPPRALELTVLCATRPNETVGARWSEIDLENKTWTIPKERRGKTRTEHRIPLSDRAVAILESLPRLSDEYVFASVKKGNGHLNRVTISRLLKRMGYSSDEAVTHGFRSCFRDWSAELTNYPNEVLEMCLGHKIDDKVEAAYRRGDLSIKRTNAMQDWSDYCASTPAAVLPMRKSA